jgi:Protein of unknown function (DUF3575)
MVRSPVLLLFFLCFTFQSFAQKNNKEFSPSITLRTNLFSILEADAGIMPGIRYQWSKQFAAVLDPTFIFFNPYRNVDNNSGQPFGIKIRSDVRYYFDKYKPGHNRFFIAPELHFKHITTKKSATFGINCIGQQCSYYMNAIYKEIKNEIGAALKMGAESYIDKKNLWSFEIYCGLGFKYNHYKEKDIPVGGMFISQPDHGNIFESGEDAIPILPGSIKISYRIR